MPEMSLSQAKKWPLMGERALDSEAGVEETTGKREQQTPRGIARLH